MKKFGTIFKVIKNIGIIFVLIMVIILMWAASGYGTVSFEDVSNIKPYSEVVGLGVTSKEEVIIHGWTEGDSTVKNPVFYSFSLPPGTGNRFVKYRAAVPVGLKLTIVAVERCTNCFLAFEPKLQFRVILQNLKTDHELPIYLDDSFLVQEWGQDNEPTIYDHSVFAVDP